MPGVPEALVIPSVLRRRLKTLRFVRDAVDVYELARRRLSGTYDRTRLFRHVKLQTNNLCTRRCSFCEFGLPEREPKARVMADALFEKILGELEALRYDGRLSLFEINEPLTDKRLLSLLHAGSRRLPGAFHTLTSNGDLLTGERLAALFDAGLDRLYLSSYDDEGRRRNLELIAGASPENRERVVHQDMVAIPEELLDNRGGSVTLRGLRSRGRGRPCERVEKLISIKPSGLVVSCASDFYGVNAMGDLNTQTMTEVWFGPRFEALRAALRSGSREASPLRAKCDYPGYGGFYEVGAGGGGA